MTVSADNIFVGATVSKDKKKYLVIKVNAKSFYAAENLTFDQWNTMWENRFKGTTFKALCESHHYLMYKYSDKFEVEESESKKKTLVESVKVASKKTSSGLTKLDKEALKDLLRFKRLHNYQNIQVGNNTMRVLANQDNQKFLLNLNDDYVLYNNALDLDMKIGNVYETKLTMDTIPWNKITPAV